MKGEKKMNKKEKIKSGTIALIIVLVIYFCGVITIPVLKNIRTFTLKTKVIYSIKIDVEKINLRSEINLSKDTIVREVYKDEMFEVIKYYEGNSYNWYNVIYDDNEVGWIASGKEEPWVTVINE